jgi:hypothetical protein
MTNSHLENLAPKGETMKDHNIITRRETCEDVLGVLGIGNGERLHYLADDMDFEAETAGLIVAAIKSGCFKKIESTRPAWIQADCIPNDSHTVLIFVEATNRPVRVGYCDDYEWFDIYNQPVTVTHWMEFPEPPHANEEG